MEQITQKEIEQFLRQKNIRPSYLRIKVLEYFFIHHNHPSVNMIYDALQDIIPTLSKTSIYNTLSLYVQHNILEALGVSANEQRYDLYRQATHAHFLCENCGRIWDMNLEHLDELIEQQFEGFIIQTKTLQFTGICPECAAKIEAEKLKKTSK